MCLMMICLVRMMKIDPTRATSRVVEAEPTGVSIHLPPTIEQSGLSAHEEPKLQKLYVHEDRQALSFKTALSRTKTNKQTTTRALPSTKN